MRLHRLEVEGFGPFARRQSVDFDAYADDGLFLITGKTGAGKSSILDAVCFALYGSIPRFSDGSRRVRSDHSFVEDPTEVVLEFSTADDAYRITRSPDFERPKLRGEGTTKVAQRVQLDRRVGDQWQGIASRAVDVGHALDEILQLTKEQFLQVILLAQNRFARFLLAKNDERLTLLRTLFGTKRFEDYQVALDTRRRASEQGIAAEVALINDRLSDAETVAATFAATDAAPGEDEPEASAPPEEPRVEHDSTSIDDRLAALDRAVQRGAYRVETLRDAHAVADGVRVSATEALRETQQRRDKQQRRDQTREVLAGLEAREPEVAAARVRLQAARAAHEVRPFLDAADHAETAQLAAHTEYAEAQRAWSEVADAGEDAAGFAAPADAEQMRGRADELTAEIGSLASVQADESQLSDLEAACQSAAEAEENATETVRALRAESHSIPADIVEREKRIVALNTTAERLPALEQRLTELEQKRAAAVQIEGAQRDAQAALTGASEANAASLRASKRMDALYQRKLNGSAAELASTLVEGESCPVCGSIDHPTPAPAHVDPVTADDLDAAARERDDLATRATNASARSQKALAALAAFEAAAGGRSREDIDAEFSTAEGELNEARLASTQSATEAEERDRLAQRQTIIAADLSTAETNQARAALESRSARDRLATQTASVQAARGSFPSVAERVNALRTQRDTAAKFAASIEALVRAGAALVKARADLDGALSRTPFDTEVAARAAALSEQQISALDDDCATHAADLRAARATLFDLELELLPEEPIDVQTAADAAESAQQEWARLGREVQAVTTTLEHVRSRTSAASVAHRRHAETVAEHETIARLADTIAGRGPNTMRMSLETFILAAELEEIVAAANVRLADMSDGRYRLVHTDERAARNAASGLGIEVFDTFTSRSRSAHSLSGGETFLASLALALGLAEVVTARAGGVRLDTLFIDEGFGSLDADTLDGAMHTLDELRAGGRTVGVISHVEAMKEQIPAQLHVVVAADGSSDIVSR